MAVSEHRRKIAGGGAANRGVQKDAAGIEGEEQGEDSGGVGKREEKPGQVPLVKAKQDKGGEGERSLADQVSIGAEVQRAEGPEQRRDGADPKTIAEPGRLSLGQKQAGFAAQQRQAPKHALQEVAEDLGSPAGEGESPPRLIFLLSKRTDNIALPH